MTTVTGWEMREGSKELVRARREVAPLTASDALVRIAGCGVCHTDLGFYFDGVPTRRPFPLTLGHEVSGIVAAAGPGAESWIGRAVVVPAVIPCGRCAACLAGRGSICAEQVFPGSTVHGGFGSHLKVPAAGLCTVDRQDGRVRPAARELQALAVVADAVSTPYQAIRRSGLQAGDLAVFVGAGGVGGFGCQIAAALGALVIAVDVDQDRLDLLLRHGASLGLRADRLEGRDLRRAVTAFAAERSIPSWRHRIFETSGTPAGQAAAFGLLGPGAFLSVVGYAREPVSLRLANLMAFDATAQGNWGCLPEHYPAVVDLVLSGRVALEPFIERRPLADIQKAFDDVHARRTNRRLVLVTEH
jgi:6-hydroxycyclohex-1-ene-1-carbonyl-CoA dehydrogenase